MRQKYYRRALEAIESIEASETREELFARLRNYTTSLGGTSLIIGRVINPILVGKRIDNFGMSDWPEEWAKRWIQDDLILHDPITRHAMRAGGTFDWSEAKENGTTYGNRLLDEGKDFAFDHGLAIPIMVGIMPMGIVSVGYKVPISPEELRHLEMVASHAYIHTLSMLDEVAHEWMPDVPLTAREIDVLSFTAVGKSAWEIGTIYSISESTVNKHLANIGRKLGTSNKTHAVAVALRTGQLMP